MRTKFSHEDVVACFCKIYFMVENFFFLSLSQRMRGVDSSFSANISMETCLSSHEAVGTKCVGFIPKLGYLY